MEKSILKLQILAKAEATLIKANARRAALRARLYAIAVGLLLLALVMVNLAALELLSQTLSGAAAAGIVALVDGALAVITIFSATRIQPGREEAMVRDIREMALRELSADIDDVKGGFDRIGTDLNTIRSGVGQALGVIKTGGSGVGSLVLLLNLITSMLKRRTRS